MDEYGNACDLFLLPSLNEGNPTVMIEALGCGKPFVGTKVGGVPEIITSDEFGLLVEPGDMDDLAEKILVAQDMKWDRRFILKYAERYMWGRGAEAIMEVYPGKIAVLSSMEYSEINNKRSVSVLDRKASGQIYNEGI